MVMKKGSVTMETRDLASYVTMDTITQEDQVPMVTPKPEKFHIHEDATNHARFRRRELSSCAQQT